MHRDRGLVRSALALGSSALLATAIGLVRTKFAAVLLGPAGIGLISLLQGIITTAAAIGSLGSNTAGVRTIADAKTATDPQAFAAARAALALNAWVAGIAASIAVFLARELIAIHVLRAPELAGLVAWMAVGVAVAVVGTSQMALLNGLRQVSAMARGQVVAGVLSAVVGVSVLWYLDQHGIALFVLALPLATLLVYRVAIFRLRLPDLAAPLALLLPVWRKLIVLGLPIMAAGLVVAGGQLAARVIVKDQAGLADLGLFQAAWLISVTYVTFIMNGMLADYLPRLTAATPSPEEARAIIGAQLEIGLLLAGPILLVAIALAPIAMVILYSSEFADATPILRWQAVGDIIKVAWWPLSYALIAAGASRRFFLAELAGTACFLVSLFWLVSRFGVGNAGIASVAMHLAQGAILVVFVAKHYGWRPSIRVMTHITILLLVGGAVTLLGNINELAASAAGMVAAFMAAGWSVVRLSHISGRKASLSTLVERFRSRPAGRSTEDGGN